jgi:transglutaminase-like putative cysteine protease
MKKISLSFLLLLTLLSVTKGYSHTKNYQIDKQVTLFSVFKNYTFTALIEQDKTVLTQLAVNQLQRSALTYFPDKQRLHLVSAYVIKPNGKKIEVRKSNIFTRPSSASREAPGFTNSLTTTVVFPQLTPGSKIHIAWKITQFKPSPFGFRAFFQPDFFAETKQSKMIIEAPANLSLKTHVKSPIKFTKEIDDDKQTLTFKVANYPSHLSENYMVSRNDVLPYGMVTSQKSWKAFGEVWRGFFDQRIRVDQKIRVLAKRIVGTQRGLAAARALYDWEINNINYISVTTGQAGSYTPHTPKEILNNGYGDCKDYVTLLASLLKSVGIYSSPVSVSWGSSYTIFPITTPLQVNHAILYLPKYDLFLNPTNRYATFGTLGNLLSNKFALVLSSPIQIKQTPPSFSKNNGYLINSAIKITTEGDIIGKNSIHFYGTTNNDIRNKIANTLSKKKFADRLLTGTQYGGFGDFKSSNPENLNKNMTIKSNWKSRHALPKENSLYFTTPIGIDFYNPNMLRHFLSDSKRKFPEIVGAITLNWSYTIDLPSNFAITRIPESSYLKNKAGSFKSVYRKINNKIFVRRKLIINKNVYSVGEYPALAQLFYFTLNDFHNIFVAAKSTKVKNNVNSKTV